MSTFQSRVAPWMQECFGEAIAKDVRERGDRLLEETLELLQSHGYDQGRVATLCQYVYDRPAGEPAQEVGGVMVTLAAYCLATEIDMHEAGETELARITVPEVVERIRQKQASKRGLHTPLPVPQGGGVDDAKRDELQRLRALVNTPELHDFARGVTLEAAHQRERWGNEHDAGKTAADWFWLVGYLAGKALHSQNGGDTDKALHHTISTAAALANWHGAIIGTHNMRPGIDGEAPLAPATGEGEQR